MQVYDITISSPLGETPARISFADGQGHMTGKGGSGPMEALEQVDDNLTFNVRIDRPMPMTMKFKGRIDGDSLSGTVKFGMFASGTFAGSKSA
ncbi:hypothetical protein KUH32_02990 [Thalassococcus sp. CAU 1522]|uniref:Uncharacterized protein n=1 Tax=Thalassococcus arenae TaxID=2851652 RepID=A0ABS6N3Z1_9RHOB|nr:hypothetical protein [Thalassococcus arenae]MBV2358726.1 hypothetical protein [Thalassococcus arenae]